MRGRPRKNDIPDEDIDVVIDIYKSGKGLDHIAKMFNVTPYLVRKVLTSEGVKIRRQGRMNGFKPLKKDVNLFDEVPDTEADPFKEERVPVDDPILAPKEEKESE